MTKGQDKLLRYDKKPAVQVNDVSASANQLVVGLWSTPHTQACESLRGRYELCFMTCFLSLGGGSSFLVTGSKASKYNIASCSGEGAPLAATSSMTFPRLCVVMILPTLLGQQKHAPPQPRKRMCTLEPEACNRLNVRIWYIPRPSSTCARTPLSPKP